MWSKCLTLLVTKALLVYSWEQEVTSSILHCDFVVTITDDACVQRGWGDYYEGWYQSRWQPVAATLKADPRCVYSPSRDDAPLTFVCRPRLCSYPYTFEDDERELCRSEHNVSKAACWEVIDALVVSEYIYSS